MHEKILEKLKEFNDRQLSDEGLERWMLSHLQEILDSQDDRAIRLLNELDALFIDETEGLRSHEMVLRSIDSIYIRESSTDWIEQGPIRIRSSSMPTIQKRFNPPHIVTSLTGVSVG